MFALNHRTYRHAAPRMAQTLRKLRYYMEKEKTHTISPGRTSQHPNSHTLDAGFQKLIIADVSGDLQTGDGVSIEDEIDGNDGDLDVN